MPLHRDVYWVGRQWAVTGHGMQAVDQKQKSKFDIEVARLWDDGLADGLSAQRWFNPADFNEGLAIARARYPLAGSSEPKLAKESAAAPTSVSPSENHASTATRSVVSESEPAKVEAGSKRAVPKQAAPKPPSRGAAEDTAEATRARTLDLRRQALTRSEPRKRAADTITLPLDGAKYAMRVDGGCAKFTTMWRVRISR